MARDALDRSRVPGGTTAVHAALQTGSGAWIAFVDRDGWRTVLASRERTCTAAFDDAQRSERRARGACELARRRFEGFERHRGRALEAFRAEEERREETERDEMRVRS